MDTTAKTMITVETEIGAPLQKVWEYFTLPEHITRWNHASDDWHSPSAKNDLWDGGEFLVRMESKDGKTGFDFGGIYDRVREHELIEYTMGDGRRVSVRFSEENGSTRLVESFEAETMHSIELQRGGWQAILDNFKKYTESR